MRDRLVRRYVSRLVLDAVRDGFHAVASLRHDSHRIEFAFVVVVWQFVFNRFPGLCVFEESIDFHLLIGPAVIEREDGDIDSVCIMQLSYILPIFPISLEISLRRRLVVVGFLAGRTQSSLQCVVISIGSILRMQISPHRLLRLVDKLLEFRFVLRDESDLLGERAGDMAELTILRLELIE